MAIPTAITDLSATIASNSPAGGDAAFPNIDDYLRAAYGFIRQGDTKASDVASAATVDLGAVVGRIVDVTGTTTITSFGTVAAGIWRIVRFTGALTLTHNATSLILPGGANITTAAGDTCTAVSLGSGNWVVTQYQRASRAPEPVFVYAGCNQQTISAPSTFTTIALTERLDPYSCFATNTFTAPTAGYYECEITVFIQSGSSANETRWLGFSIDGAAVSDANSTRHNFDWTNDETHWTFKKILNLTAGQTVTPKLKISTTSVTLWGDSTYTTEQGWFYVRRV